MIAFLLALVLQAIPTSAVGWEKPRAAMDAEQIDGFGVCLDAATCARVTPAAAQIGTTDSYKMPLPLLSDGAHTVAVKACRGNECSDATPPLPFTFSAQGASDVGIWQNVTPAAIPLNGNPGNNCEYGAIAVAVAPPSRVYLGSCQRGFFRSDDSGVTWVHINTGLNAGVLDGSRQWSIAVDPTNPDVVYTNSGYGPNGENGAWKSINGGVDWLRIWPSASASSSVVQYNFVAQITLDPTDHTHVLLSWHGTCAAPLTPVCYGESHDGGATFTIHPGDSRWADSESQTLYLVDATHWLFANHSPTDGLWFSTNAGTTWTAILGSAGSHWPSTVYRTAAGVTYIGDANGLYRSPDFATWTHLNVGYLISGILGDGTTLFAGNAGTLTPWTPVGTNVYMTSPENDGLAWTPAPWPVPAGQWTQGPGGGFAYDAVNHYLFSSNGTTGLWRVRTSAGGPPPPPPPPPPPVHTCERVYRYDGIVIYVPAPLAECGGS